MAMKNKWEMVGVRVAILLSNGMWTYIDREDFDKVNSIKGTWGFKWNPTAHTYYARWQAGGRKNRHLIYLHRFILDVTDHEVQVDHQDHDGLNNSRDNLLATCVKGNSFNRRGAQINNRSGKRNVYWNAREQQWMVWLVCMGTRHYVGYFKNVDEADSAAQALRLSLGGKA